jgi:hypothetical protein
MLPLDDPEPLAPALPELPDIDPLDAELFEPEADWLLSALVVEPFEAVPELPPELGEDEFEAELLSASDPCTRTRWPTWAETSLPLRRTRSAPRGCRKYSVCARITQPSRVLSPEVLLALALPLAFMLPLELLLLPLWSLLLEAPVVLCELDGELAELLLPLLLWDGCDCDCTVWSLTPPVGLASFWWPLLMGWPAELVLEGLPALFWSVLWANAENAQKMQITKRTRKLLRIGDSCSREGFDYMAYSVGW